MRLTHLCCRRVMDVSVPAQGGRPAARLTLPRLDWFYAWCVMGCCWACLRCSSSPVLSGKACACSSCTPAQAALHPTLPLSTAG